jgi:hypothetical protein
VLATYRDRWYKIDLTTVHKGSKFGYGDPGHLQGLKREQSFQAARFAMLLQSYRLLLPRRVLLIVEARLSSSAASFNEGAGEFELE